MSPSERAERAVDGDRVGDRAQVVRSDRRPHVRPGLEQPARERLEVAIRLALLLEYRRRPAALARVDHLVVPVRALDEPHHDRRSARRRARPLDHLLELLGRLAQVGLQTTPVEGPSRSSGLGEQLEDEPHGRLERVDRLHVDVQVGAELARADEQRPHAPGRVVAAKVGRLRPQQRAQRRHLHGQVHARQRPASPLEHRPGRATPAPPRRASRARQCSLRVRWRHVDSRQRRQLQAQRADAYALRRPPPAKKEAGKPPSVRPDPPVGQVIREALARGGIAPSTSTMRSDAPMRPSSLTR